MKKNKILTLSLVLLAGLSAGSLTSCDEGGTYEYALVTDVGDINDASFNQTSWEALQEFCQENDKTYAYYRPTENSTAARLLSIDQAVQRGAKVIVCPGYLFEDAVYSAQTTYPEVKFVLIDGTPHPTDSTEATIADNTVSIIFQEEIPGFLAGYAAVMDGNTKLGFCGGMAVPAVQRYGSGFVQGADYAAQQLKTNIEVNYYYAGDFAATDAATAMMRTWYTNGTETVFASGGKVYLSVEEACDAAGEGKTWIGVDVDQSSVDTKVLTSAMKGLRESVISSLEEYANDKWDVIGGKSYTLGLNSKFGDLENRDYVGIPTAESSWRFETFTLDQYNAILTSIKNGTVTITNSTTEAPTVSSYTTVDYVSSFATAA